MTALASLLDLRSERSTLFVAVSTGISMLLRRVAANRYAEQRARICRNGTAGMI